MGARGRKSSAELSVVDGGRVESHERPDAPGYLNDEQAEVWRVVVNDYAAAKFPPSTWDALAGLCMSIVAMRRVSQLIGAAEREVDDFDIKTYDRLLRMLRQQNADIRSGMVKLRIAPSTLDDRRKGGPAEGTPPPWV